MLSWSNVIVIAGCIPSFSFEEWSLTRFRVMVATPQDLPVHAVIIITDGRNN